MTLGVVGALREELDDVLRLMADAHREQTAGREFHVGHLHGVPVVCTLSRVGKVAAAHTARFEDNPADRVSRANAALAAARWLDPEGTREAAEAMVAARPAGLPAPWSGPAGRIWSTTRTNCTRPSRWSRPSTR